MTISKLAHDYIKKAIELANNDLKQLEKKNTDYLQPVSSKSIKTYFKR